MSSTAPLPRVLRKQIRYDGWEAVNKQWTYTHARTHARRRTQTHIHIHMTTNTHKHSQTHTNTHKHTQTHTHIHALTHAHTTHTHTHKHTHTRSHSACMCVNGTPPCPETRHSRGMTSSITPSSWSPHQRWNDGEGASGPFDWPTVQNKHADTNEP